MQIPVVTKPEKKSEPPANIPCPQCMLSFKTEAILNYHISRSHKIYECGVCTLQFDQRVKVKQHMVDNHSTVCKYCNRNVITCDFKAHMTISHSNLLPEYLPIKLTIHEKIKCKLCDDNFVNKKAAKTHYYWTHEKYACDLCMQIFSVKKDQDEHTREVHVIPCSYCDAEFYTSRRYKRHVSKAHKVQSSKNITQITKAPDQIYECKFCRKGLSDKFNVRRHNFWSHIKHTCLICLRTFDTIEQEEKHFSNHGDTCVWCEVRFSSDVQLSQHMQSEHPGLLPWYCEYCGDSFNKNAELHEHRASHKLEDTYLCYICGKSFKTSTILTSHISGHKSNDEKQKECNVCHKKFCFQSQLNSHMLKHTKEKSYQCSDCNKSFINCKSLEKHMHTHLNMNYCKFKCNFCGMNFKKKITLNSHIVANHLH